jgi:hypothetical protein
MNSLVGTGTTATLVAASVVTFWTAACGRAETPQDTQSLAPEPQQVPQSLSMGGAKSVTTFFVTSRGAGRGGDLGGLAGADAHCQTLALGRGIG